MHPYFETVSGAIGDWITVTVPPVFEIPLLGAQVSTLLASAAGLELLLAITFFIVRQRRLTKQRVATAVITDVVRERVSGYGSPRTAPSERALVMPLRAMTSEARERSDTAA